MQETRQQILDILKTHQMLTVDKIVDALREKRGDNITAVTVRHHLSILQADGFIETPEMKHRNAPGRPQYLYALTERGYAQFPTNYQKLAEGLLRQMGRHVHEDTVNVILEGIADDMMNEADIPDGALSDRLDAVVDYLTNHGYNARWERASQEDAYLLYMDNCPYHHLSHQDETLCHLDMRLISKMLGVVPRFVSRIALGDKTCAYLIPDKEG